MQDSINNLECNICGGAMREGFTTICACNAEPITKVENVPAYICTVCEESVITGPTLRVIERIKSENIRSRIVECKVIDFPDAEQRITERSTEPTWTQSATMVTAGTSGQVGTDLISVLN